MSNSPLYQKCLEVATEAHKGQFLNDGVTPYITHPIAVAEMVNTETEKCVALLHDVLEDTDYTTFSLRKLDVPPYIVQCVLWLTHPVSETYLEYILQIKKCHSFLPEVIKVKLADMAHNSLTCSKTMRNKYDLARYILTH
jgi:(p)ppGpp synthase/HD superfamily hydrolase